MNRSFRGPETLMPSIRPRVPQLKSHRASAMREKEDDLALFLEMRKREKEKNDLLLLRDSEELDESLVSQPGSSPLFNIPSTTPARKTGLEDFLNLDGEKNDYDWLLTPPGTPLFPSLEMESRKSYIYEREAPKSQPAVLRSRLANSQTETTGRNSLMPRQPTASTGLTSSNSGMRRPSSSGGPGSRPSSSGGSGSRPVTPGGGSRPATPTGRPTSTSSKPSRSSTPTSRGTLSSSKPSLHSSSPKPLTSMRSTASATSTRSAGPSRSSTPSRSTTATRSSVPSAGPSRSSTPTRSTARSATPTRSTARSSTSTARPSAPSAPISRSTSRTSTPTRRPSAPSSVANITASLNKSSSISSKSVGLAPSRSAAPSCGTSPTVRSRPWNPSEMPGFSLDAPKNLRTTLPDRPLSATRGRPAAPSARSASVEPVSNGRPRRQSCSPSRGRTPNGKIHSSGSSVPAVSRGHSKVNDDVSPVVIGTKMVERVINMRKLAPPRQDDKHSPGLSGKSASSPDSSGFGRTLSKKSLDMAIRHMDIRRSIPGNLRPLMTKVPASSMYSVRSGPAGSRTASVSDSPLATSSNASSERSVNNHNPALDGHGSELEDDLPSERGCHASPTIVYNSRLL
ncbi:uncharacterized protein LOC130804174 isoform X2 [Amaranthus tricolor]|uniref:uncharacterized protein LOC130804174 isoform X2 n=1 Tax=Amaranthus tricolor TaxID=29722 RepID=UPI0025866E68|nr:uncharacterized protein LOC130804174 isoform X2 [Amaranthus tricolor]